MDEPIKPEINNQINSNEAKIEFKAEVESVKLLNGENYLIKIGKINEGQEIIFQCELENMCSLEYYSNKTDIKSFINLSKVFRQFDTVDEVFIGLNNVFNKSEENRISVTLTQPDENNIQIDIKLPLLIGGDETINLTLSKKTKDKNDVIKDLQKYIKQLSGFIDFYEIINKENKDFIENAIKQKEKRNFLLKLIYKASRDGDNGAAFHSKCDNIFPTLTVIKTADKKIIGGYTTVSWECTEDKKKDDKAFCFDMTDKKIYNCNEGEYSILCRKDCGPCFWDGKSSYAYLYCDDEFFSSFNHTCKTFESSQATERDCDISSANRDLKIEEIEVFQVELI